MTKPSANLTAIILSVFAVLVSVLALTFATGLLDAGNRPVSSDFQIQARQYMLENPEIVIEAIQRLEERRQDTEVSELQTMIAERRDEIFNDPASPIAGSPDGDVSLVEFFDYNCPYCRMAAPYIEQAMEDDKRLKIVYKEWPILGPGSEFAAKAALASRKQEKYRAFHKALMSYSGTVSQRSALAVAEEVGLDIQRLKRDMEDPAIAAAIERNRALANDLRITGTPTFVVGDEIIRGLVDLATLQEFIAKTREDAKG